jgi:hypothetical protein
VKPWFSSNMTQLLIATMQISNYTNARIQILSNLILVLNQLDLTQKHKNTKTQKHKNTKTQKHKNTKTQKHKNTKTQKTFFFKFLKKVKPEISGQ